MNVCESCYISCDVHAIFTECHTFVKKLRQEAVVIWKILPFHMGKKSRWTSFSCLLPPICIAWPSHCCTASTWLLRLFLDGLVAPSPLFFLDVWPRLAPRLRLAAPWPQSHRVATPFFPSSWWFYPVHTQLHEHTKACTHARHTHTWCGEVCHRGG